MDDKTHSECQLYAFGVEVKATSDLVVGIGSLLKFSSVALVGEEGVRVSERVSE